MFEFSTHLFSLESQITFVGERIKALILEIENVSQIIFSNTKQNSHAQSRKQNFEMEISESNISSNLSLVSKVSPIIIRTLLCSIFSSCFPFSGGLTHFNITFLIIVVPINRKLEFLYCFNNSRPAGRTRE